jgi:peptidoglycan/xylan/chitin deacetylase (PgdA/CDA1 family)
VPGIRDYSSPRIELPRRRYPRPWYSFTPYFSIGVGVYAGEWLPYPLTWGYPAYVFDGECMTVWPLPSPPESFGGISLDIEPGDAVILVDGVRVGAARDFSPAHQPLTLTPGRHRIELRAEDMRPLAFDIDVRAGRVLPLKGALQPQVSPVSSNTPHAGSVSILAYHRFGPSAVDAMTVRTSTFRAQLDSLHARGCQVVSLAAIVSALTDRTPLPPCSVAITADDGHVSVYQSMLPIVREYRIPVTLFIYPSAISRTPYAMTWAELDELRNTGLFEIESHTYWHPNFRTEKRRLAPAAYEAFVTMQMRKSRDLLNSHLAVRATLLAWPFGIQDDELIGFAREAGYSAGFTIDGRVVSARDSIMALPRFLVTDRATGRAFAAMLPEAP